MQNSEDIQLHNKSILFITSCGLMQNSEDIQLQAIYNQFSKVVV